MLDFAATLQPLLKRLDAALLAVLVIARVRIDTLADATALPLRQQDAARQPFFSHLLPKPVMTLLAQQGLVDPIGLLLVVAALAALIAYLLVAEFVRHERASYRLRMGLLGLIIALTIFAPSLKMTLLRQGSGPASYSHDGGVIQTEATINYLLAGRNPYVEDYTQTPMAEWGISEFRTALYHYPYLPWTFLFSAPFKLLADHTIGWFDERFVYLLLFALTLCLLPGLTRSRPAALLLVMLVGLNPQMGSDLIYGQNDSFVLAWLVISLWALARAWQRNGTSRRWYALSAVAFGLACASKPTAWFFAPFYLALIAAPILQRTDRSAPVEAPALASRPASLQAILRRGWPALAAAALVVGPYFIWNPGAMIDDVWGWSSGTSATAYQIWGWGASNLVLAFGWLQTRFAYWPFWLPELIVAVPLLAALLRRQVHDNTLAQACWGYALFLLAFFFVSRFLNENYLGFILAFFALGLCASASCPQPDADPAPGSRAGYARS